MLAVAVWQGAPVSWQNTPTPYNIMSHGDAQAQAIAAWLKENYIDKGKLGRASGEGFYRYPVGN